MTAKESAPPKVARVDTHFVTRVDPFAAESGHFWSSLLNAVLATALFRCWHLILFFTAWATLIGCLIEINKVNLNLQSTLLTVFGTVLGFVISYRTSSSFERYNEGRKFWSSVILATRTFARGVWFHVSDTAASTPNASPEEIKARTLIEKKTVLNLLEAFGVSLKHYLRGEDGAYYEDLYHLVRFLPAYDLPAGLPSPMPRASTEFPGRGGSAAHLPLPATTTGLIQRIVPLSPSRSTRFATKEEVVLLPARNPPHTSIFDVFPFSLLTRILAKKGVEVSGKKALREKAKLNMGSQNIPLEISLYLSSYIAALQARKAADVPTTNLLLASLGQLADSLTGLERILTTPIPFSYSVHLWTVTIVYVLSLPFQLWATLKWVTIPATAIAAFIFFGFLVCGEEIENPFGFDRNDLNMDHFTHNIIRVELQALTALPVPDPAAWAFSAENDAVFDSDTFHNGSGTNKRLTPEQWVKKGTKGIRDVLATGIHHDQIVVLPPVKEESIGKRGGAKFGQENLGTGGGGAPGGDAPGGGGGGGHGGD